MGHLVTPHVGNKTHNFTNILQKKTVIGPSSELRRFYVPTGITYKIRSFNDIFVLTLVLSNILCLSILVNLNSYLLSLLIYVCK